MWHYDASVQRERRQLMPLTISIRFPHTDLAEVTARLRSAAREIAGYPPDDGQQPAP
jgi:hypothetical protein